MSHELAVCLGKLLLSCCQYAFCQFDSKAPEIEREGTEKLLHSRALRPCLPARAGSGSQRRESPHPCILEDDPGRVGLTQGVDAA